MFKREINRRWGLTAARAWARLLIERIHILVFAVVAIPTSLAGLAYFAIGVRRSGVALQQSLQ
jgi:hypothetical protein